MTSCSVKNTEKRLPADCTRCGTPSLASASPTSPATAAAAPSTAAYTAGVHSFSVASPAAPATGFPDSVPAWYTGPAGARYAITSARPPNAAAGSPPLMTLPNVNRSASTGSSPYQPAADTRNPVITSSRTSSAPFSTVILRSAALKPGRGDTTPMLAAAASVITHAISGPNRSKASATAPTSLYGSTIVSAAWAPVTPGVSGSPRVATPDPAAASSASTWPW